MPLDTKDVFVQLPKMADEKAKSLEIKVYYDFHLGAIYREHQMKMNLDLTDQKNSSDATFYLTRYLLHCKTYS